MSLVKDVFLMLVRVLNTFILLSLLFFGSMVFILGYMGYSTKFGSPLVSIICGGMFIFASFVLMVIILYDYQKIKLRQSGAPRERINLVKEVFLILERVLIAFVLPSLLLFATIIYLLACFKYGSIFGSPIASIICSGMIIFTSTVFIITFLYDYQKKSKNKFGGNMEQ